MKRANFYLGVMCILVFLIIKDCQCANQCLLIKYATMPLWGYCICIEGYIWKFEYSLCGRDCSFDRNAIDFNKTVIEECQCKPTYIWDHSRQQCVRNCSTYIGLDSSNISRCICPVSYSWNNNYSACVLNCNTDPHAISFNTTAFNQCLCVSNFVWEKNRKICVRDCQISLDVGGVSPTNISQCICLRGLYWDDSKGCTFDCQALLVVHALQKHYIFCGCPASYYFDLQTHTCKNCSLIPSTIPSPNVEPNRCLCHPNFFFHLVLADCVRNCSADQYAESIDEADYNQCICIDGFIWDNNRNACIINCQKIKNAIKLNPLNIGKCICKPNYKWLQNGTCYLDCSTIPNVIEQYKNKTSLSVLPNIDQFCFCKEFYFWDFDMNFCVSHNNTVVKILNFEMYASDCPNGFQSSFLGCARACENDPNAIQNQYQPQHPSKCNCNIGYIWNSTLNLCVRNCSQIFFTMGLNQSNISQCICQSKFILLDNDTCYLNCSNIQYVDINYPQPRSNYDVQIYMICRCAQNYYWNVIQNICQQCLPSYHQYDQCKCQRDDLQHQKFSWSCCKQCYLDENAYFDVSPFSNFCFCHPGYIWDTYKVQCVRDCANIDWAISLNLFNINQCICQDKLIWSNIYQMCYLNCSIVSNAVGFADPTFVGFQYKLRPRCQCSLNYYWDFKNKVCVSCSLTPYTSITFSSNGTINQCACQTNFYWHPNYNLCMRNCSTDINSVNTMEYLQNKCYCLIGFVWNTLYNVCAKNCSSDPFATSLSTTNTSQCQCVIGFIWNDIFKLCVRGCVKIDGADSLNETDISKCICLNNYIWSVDGTCNLNIVSDPKALSIVTGLVVRTFANCSSNCYWDFSNNVCTQCITTANLSCGCAKPNFFYFPPYNLCLRNCSSSIDPFASISLNTQFPQRCICVANYIWNITLNLCVRNCSNYPMAYSLNSTNISQCLCFGGFVWHIILNKCVNQRSPILTKQAQIDNTKVQDIKINELSQLTITIIVLCTIFGFILLFVTLLVIRKCQKVQNNKTESKTKQLKIEYLQTDSQKCINIG